MSKLMSFKLFLTTFIVTASILPTAQAEDMVCQQIFKEDFLKNHSSEFIVLSMEQIALLKDIPLLDSEYNPNTNILSVEIEELAKTLSKFPEKQKAIYINQIKKLTGFKSYEFRTGDYFLLHLHDEQAWLSYVKEIFFNDQFVSFAWWYRGHLFDTMPIPTKLKIVDYLTQYIKNPENPFEERKTAYRVFTFIKNYNERPEDQVLRALKEKQDVNLVLANYFNRSANDPSPYGEISRLTPKHLGKISVILRDYFTKSEKITNHQKVYFMGSIPNGKGRMESDVDLSMDTKLTEKEVKELYELIKERNVDFNPPIHQPFDMKPSNGQSLQIMYISPISVAIIEGEISLVVRQISTPKEPVRELQDGGVLLKPFDIVLWHFPVEVDSEGNWSYDKSKLPYRLNFKN